MQTITRFRRPLIAIAIIGLAVVGYLAFEAEANLGTRARPATGGGTAYSLSGPVGFKVRVDTVQRADDQIVVTLTFDNTSHSQQRADPADFALKINGHALRPSFSSECPNWGRVDLYPQGGPNEPLRDTDGTKAPSTWGPATLCFADSSAATDLILEWRPDVAFGPLSGTTEIDLGRF